MADDISSVGASGMDAAQGVGGRNGGRERGKEGLRDTDRKEGCDNSITGHSLKRPQFMDLLPCPRI